jgi:hypothetical protein
MSLEVIVLIILLSSFLGLVFFISKKIPVLANLEITPVLGAQGSFLSGVKGRIKGLPVLKSFSLDIFLQKIISQIRVLSLKADHKTANWLKMLRQKTQKKKLDDESYWEEIKKSKGRKKKG